MGPDARFWLKWMDLMDKDGLRATYANIQGVYPPLSYLLLFIAAKVGKLFGMNHFVSLKVSFLFFLFFTSAVFYLFSRNFLLTMLVQLSLVLSSVAYCYLDIYFAPFFILSLFALKDEKYALFSLLFTISIFLKWQPVIVLPFVLVHVFGLKSLGDILRIDPRRVALLVIPFGIIVLILLVVFGVSLPMSLVNAGKGGAGGFLSANALNFNWVLTYILHMVDPLRYGGLTNGIVIALLHTKTMSVSTIYFVKMLAIIFYALAFLIYLFKAEKNFFNLLFFSLLGFLAYFTFYTNVHENHLFIVFMLSAMMYSLRREYIYWFLIWGFMANINLIAFYSLPGISVPATRIVAGIDVTVFLSLLNTIFFITIFLKAVGLKGEEFSEPDERS